DLDNFDVFSGAQSIYKGFSGTGGKGLKSTQVYPVGFGKKIASLHKDMMDFAG
ncbi:unnamed protein product, partial [Durusdinium trenchii]